MGWHNRRHGPRCGTRSQLDGVDAQRVFAEHDRPWSVKEGVVTRKTHLSRAGDIARMGRPAVMAVLVALMLGQGAIAARAADDEITVMTRNLYQGADLGPVIAAQTQNEFL